MIKNNFNFNFTGKNSKNLQSKPTTRKLEIFKLQNQKKYLIFNNFKRRSGRRINSKFTVKPLKDRYIDGWRNRQIDRQIDRQTDRQIDKQIDRQIILKDMWKMTKV